MKPSAYRNKTATLFFSVQALKPIYGLNQRPSVYCLCLNVSPIEKKIRFKFDDIVLSVKDP